MSALRGLGVNRLNTKTDEFAISLSNGATFFTGGFDTQEGLIEAIQSREPIAGAFAPSVHAWIKTVISPSAVVAVADLRETTADS